MAAGLTKEHSEVDDTEAGPVTGGGTFDELRRRKWKLGRIERGLEDDDPFDGDPARELQNETFDIPNYAEELLARGEIGLPEAERLHAMSVDMYLFMEAVINRRAMPLGARRVAG